MNLDKSYGRIFLKIKNEIYNYFQIKLVTSLLTGLLSFTVLFFFSSDLSVVSQLVVGNFIEPKLMGKSLNLSPLIMLLTLSVMGKLWGLSGMFLSVPILVILLIIFSNFNKTRKIAIFLSEKGNIS